MPRQEGIRQLPSKRCGCERCREKYPEPERRRTVNCSAKWQVRYYDDAGNRKSGGTFRRREDAVKRLDQLRQTVASGTWQDPKRGKMTLAAFRKQFWLPTREAREDATRAREESHWNAHVRVAWGGKTLRTLEQCHAEIQAWVAGMQKGGLSRDSVESIHNCLDQMLAFAVRDKRIGSNPCDWITFQAKRRIPVADGRSPTVAEIDEVAEHMAAVYRQLPRFDVETGLRWGELAALPPEQVDLEGCEARIRWVVEEIGGRKRIREYPKSHAGYRAVPLTQAACRQIEIQYGLQPPVARPAGGDPVPIFRGARGAVLDRGNYRDRVLLPAARAAGVYQSVLRASGQLEHWPTMHDCRATFADRLDRGRVPRGLVKLILGHDTDRTDVTDRYLRGAADLRALVLRALGDESAGPVPVPERLRLVG